MTSILNNVDIISGVGNTGKPEKEINLAIITAIILVPLDFKVPAASMTDAATALAYLQAATIAAEAQRIYPFGPFEGMTDQSEAPTFQTMGYGAKFMIKEGKYTFEFQWKQGGLAYNKMIRKFNNSSAFKVLLIDNSPVNKVIGNDISGDLYGFSLGEIYTFPVKPADGSKIAEFKTQITLEDVTELNDNYGVLPLEAGLGSKIQGITDVVLGTPTKTGTTTVIVSISAKEFYTGTSMGDDFATELAAAAAWVVTKAGAPVTPSSVAYTASTDTFDLSIGSSPTGDHVFNLASAAALAALGVGAAPDGGFESTGSKTLSLG